MAIADLPEELKAKVEGKSPEELLALAREEGYVLSDEEMESISGGEWVEQVRMQCPSCNRWVEIDHSKDWQKCPYCGEVFLREDA